MGDKTGIEWTDATWNPVTGCTKVSQGCTNCYAERVFPRTYSRDTVYDENGFLRGREFTDVKCHPDRLELPLHWKRPRRIFVNSMSDLFHESVPDGFILDVWRTMFNSPRHTFQILTKRPERMLDWCRRFADTKEDDYEPKLARGPEAVRKAHRSGRAHLFADMIEGWGKLPKGSAYPTYDWMEGMIRWPSWIGNVWLGVSCEDQATADERIPLLLQTPAAVRFVSYEPALGPVDFGAFPPFCRRRIEPSIQRELRRMFPDGLPANSLNAQAERIKLHWIIAGGESGPQARPSHPDWFRSVRDQCQAAGVAFFFKQWGEWTANGVIRVGGDLRRDLERGVVQLLHAPGNPQGYFRRGDAYVRRVGRRAAGALLDGREWNEYPEARG